MRDDHVLAADLAKQTGDALMNLRRSELSAVELRDRGDLEANALLTNGLALMRPSDVVLSEEAPDDRRRLDSTRVWIVDPLDGTREFGELDRDDWAVHVALAVNGTPSVGAVALPAQNKVISTAHPPPTPPPPEEELVFVVSRSRPPDFLADLTTRLNGTLLPMGSAGAKTMAVVLGFASVYIHAGGQYEWDSCAPVAVATAAGLHASRLDGSPLVYNQPDPYLPDLLVCHPAIAPRILDALDGFLPPAST